MSLPARVSLKLKMTTIKWVILVKHWYTIRSPGCDIKSPLSKVLGCRKAIRKAIWRAAQEHKLCYPPPSPSCGILIPLSLGFHGVSTDIGRLREVERDDGPDALDPTVAVVHVLSFFGGHCLDCLGYPLAAHCKPTPPPQRCQTHRDPVQTDHQPSLKMTPAVYQMSSQEACFCLGAGLRQLIPKKPTETTCSLGYLGG